MPLPADFEKHLERLLSELQRTGLGSPQSAWALLGLCFFRYAEHAQYDALLKRPHDIARGIERAMTAFGDEHGEIEAALPENYRQIDESLLRELLRQIEEIAAVPGGLHAAFEYCVNRLGGGEWETPKSVARLLVELVEPTHGDVYDPCCGIANLLLEASRFARGSNKAADDLRLHGTEKSVRVSALCRMNLRMHDLAVDIRSGSAFDESVASPSGQFDFVLAEPPLNQEIFDGRWGARDAVRFPFGIPTANSANYLWLQLAYSSLNENGRAGLVMAPSVGDRRGSQLEIRKKLIETGAVDAVVALAPGLLSVTTLPVTLWLFDRAKEKNSRKDRILFIDARHVYRQLGKGQRELSSEQVEYLASIVRLHRGQPLDQTSIAKNLVEKTFPKGTYEDVPGLCKAATMDEIAAQGHSLNPGRYVGVPAALRLRRLRLSNVYGFREGDLRFPNAPATVIVGANGAGKSTVLDSIAMFLSPLAAMLRNADPKKAPYALTPLAIHANADQAKAQMEVLIAGSPHEWTLSTGRINAKRTVDPSMRDWVRHVHEMLETTASASVPVFCYYPAIRFHVRESASKKRKAAEQPVQQLAAYEDAFDVGHHSFSDIVEWFRHQEDLENEIRLSGDPEHRNPRLEVVRQAVLQFMDALSTGTFDDLRVRRDPRDAAQASLVLRKDGTDLSLDTLSDGERGAVLLVADLAQRLAAANPDAADPLSGSGVVLIDEIELHMHPRWQRAVLPELIRTFRGCQFIVTTHSPQVLSRVPREQILLLSNFEVAASLAHTEGRDSNAILVELMGVPGRPEDAEAKIAELARLIDDEQFEEARQTLQELEEQYGPNDRDLLRLGAMLRALEEDAA